MTSAALSSAFGLTESQIDCLLAPLRSGLKLSPLRVLNAIRAAANSTLARPAELTAAQISKHIRHLARCIRSGQDESAIPAPEVLPYLGLEDQEGWYELLRSSVVFERLEDAAELASDEAQRGRSADPRLAQFILRLYGIFGDATAREPTSSFSTDNGELVSDFGKFAGMAVELFSPPGQIYGPGQISLAVRSIRQFERDNEEASPKEAVAILAAS